MSDVTRILNAIDRGDAKATDEFLPLVYEELRLLAVQEFSPELICIEAVFLGEETRR